MCRPWWKRHRWSAWTTLASFSNGALTMALGVVGVEPTDVQVRACIVCESSQWRGVAQAPK